MTDLNCDGETVERVLHDAQTEIADLRKALQRVKMLVPINSPEYNVCCHELESKRRGS